MAAIADSDALRSIYAQYIHSPITFEDSLPSKQAFAHRVETILREYPYLVYIQDGQVLGYAYAHRHMEREAYQWNAELSIYLDARVHAQGIGKRLYSLLMEILILQGVRNVYAGVTVPNSKSEALHRSLGFQPLGTYRRTGFKNGAWHDVTWFEKQIAPYPAFPEPFLPICRIKRKLSTLSTDSPVFEILSRFLVS